MAPSVILSAKSDNNFLILIDMYIFRVYINEMEEYGCQNGMDTSWIALDIGHFYPCFHGKFVKTSVRSSEMSHFL